MDPQKRHQRIWRFFYKLLHRPICRKFNLTHETLFLEGPCLIIANHTNAWDPLLVAMSLPKKQVYFVASEHIFRLGLLSGIIQRLVAPIPRKKAYLATDTVLACLRHLHAGHSICIFAEGEQCWDGITAPLSPTTGGLIKKSGASLVTIHIEGGYLSLPRWGKGIRRGKTKLSVAGIYSPEELKDKSEEEISALISRDIAENCWERQETEQIRFIGKRPAESLERMLYLCPSCRRIGTLHSKKDLLRCPCGMTARLTETGFFDESSPFRTVAEWDRFQIEKTAERVFVHEGLPFFSDENITLSEILAKHRSRRLTNGELRQYPDRLAIGAEEFALSEITAMAAVQAHLLLFSCHGRYFELRAKHAANLYKYLIFYQTRKD